MNSLTLTSSSSVTYWLIFLAVLLVVGLGVGGYILWLKGPPGEPRHHHKHRKRRRRHHRQQNPTLAENGGLPPKRPNGQPPAGP